MVDTVTDLMTMTATKTQTETDFVTMTDVSTVVQPTTLTSVYVETKIMDDVSLILPRRGEFVAQPSICISDYDSGKHRHIDYG